MSGSSAPKAPSFALYRIIGNDLPPRHVPGQHLRNLEFMLDHEPVLERCEKWWVLNRLTDHDEAQQLVDMLEERGCRYLSLSFSLTEYARRGWRLDFGRPIFDAAFQALPGHQRVLLEEHTYHDKNRYVMNNNGARNAALEHGRARADYVLPWDGNCFVTDSAWRELLLAVDADPGADYLVVPMARAGDAEVLHQDESWRPDARDEPQIAFAARARERFDEDLRYGRNPKAALLRALGVPGIWNERVHEPWEPGLPAPGSAEGRYLEASWVVRLTSGRSDLEHRPGRRVRQRREAIVRKLDDLDEQVARRVFRRDALFVWDERRLACQRTAWLRRDPPLCRVVGALVADGERAMAPGEGPGVDMASGMPESDVDELLVLVLGWWFTRRDDLAAAATGRVRGLVVDSVTRFTPSSDLQGLHGLIHVPEALRLLEQCGVLSAAETAAARAWYAELLGHLVGARESAPAAQRADHEGLWYEALTLAAAAYVDDAHQLCLTHRRVCSRLDVQVAADGMPNGEVSSDRSRDACASAALAWLVLARMLARFGEDLWTEQGLEGQRVSAMLRWFTAMGTGPWPYRQRVPHDLDLTELVGLRARSVAPPGTVPERDPPTRAGVALRIKQRFPTDAPVRPYWSLGE